MREPQNVEPAGWWESVTVLPRAPTTSRSAERDQTTLHRVHRETKAPEAFRQHIPHPVGVRFLLKDNDQSSRPGESHPQALTEPDMNVSAHPALTVQPLLDATSASGQRAPGRRPRWPQQTLTDRRVLGGAFPQAQRVFAACLIDAQGDDDAVPADLDPVDQ